MTEQSQEGLVERYSALELKHRAMVLGLTVVVLLVLFDIIWFQPAVSEKENLNRQLAVVKTERDDLLEQNLQYQQQLSGSAFREKRNQLKRLEQQARQIDGSLGQYAQLVSPREMPQILRDFFKQSSKLALLKLAKDNVKPAFVNVEKKENNDTLTDLLPAGTSQAELVQANFYRHDFSVKLQGGYFDLLSSLQKLESMNIKIYWDSLEYRVTQYPKAEVTVTVYTYSYAKNWIGV